MSRMSEIKNNYLKCFNEISHLNFIFPTYNLTQVNIFISSANNFMNSVFIYNIIKMNRFSNAELGDTFILVMVVQMEFLV